MEDLVYLIAKEEKEQHSLTRVFYAPMKSGLVVPEEVVTVVQHISEAQFVMKSMGRLMGGDRPDLTNLREWLGAIPANLEPQSLGGVLAALIEATKAGTALLAIHHSAPDEIKALEDLVKAQVTEDGGTPIVINADNF